ncbi:MAG: hypothetical protein OER86_03310 [Phycisphaerae bacterium]|nr:hypothetical protein [Phycisphaerae bacterium]
MAEHDPHNPLFQSLANAPVAFALTLEKPGGVVEHDPADGPLLVIAQVK